MEVTGDHNYDQFLEEINRLFMEKHNQNVNQTSTSNSAKTSIKEASFQEDHVDLSMKRFSESLKLDVKRTRRGKFPEGEKTDAEPVPQAVLSYPRDRRCGGLNCIYKKTDGEQLNKMKNTKVSMLSLFKKGDKVTPRNTTHFLCW